MTFYQVPESLSFIIGESKTVCIGVLDDLFNELFGVHIL
jgi:hypothetical protein